MLRTGSCSSIGTHATFGVCDVCESLRSRKVTASTSKNQQRRSRIRLLVISWPEADQFVACECSAPMTPARPRSAEVERRYATLRVQHVQCLNLEVFFCLYTWSLQAGEALCCVLLYLLLTLTGFTPCRHSWQCQAAFMHAPGIARENGIANVPVNRHGHKLRYLQTTSCRSDQREVLSFGHLAVSTAVACRLS